MLRIESKSEDARDVLTELLLGGTWFICCSAGNPDDMSTYVLENVTKYEVEGHFADKLNKPVFVEYGISPAMDGDYQFKIHDSVVAPILNEDMITKLIDSMLKTFDVFIVEQNMVDRKNVWGKLGTENEDKIVFYNE